MPVVNFRIKKITAERKEISAQEAATNVNVTSNFTLLSMAKKKDDMVGDYLLVNFKFNVSYKPDLGYVDLEGYLWYSAPDLSKTIKEKNGKIEIGADALKEISTAVLRDSILEAVDITRKLKLPIPVNMPKVDVKPREVLFPKAA